MRRELREDNVVSVLEELGVVPAGVPTGVRSLSGGVANTVLAVAWPAGEVVVKQALPKLRVRADWAFDPARSKVERDALAVLGRLLPAGSVPDVVAYHETDDVLVMTHAPAGGVTWKAPLLAGDADAGVAAQVGTLLGLTHRQAADDDAARACFADIWPLVQGRVDPFHRVVAERHPDLRATILDEVDRLLATRTTLVLGDCSPKNVIAYPDRVMLIDLEVAHWGDPAFDVAFMLAHLTLKARRRPEASAPLRACADAFVDAHAAAAGTRRPPDGAIVAELGCLLLSRVDGKSPVEYLTHVDGDAVRSAARALLLERPAPLSRALDLAFAAMRQQPSDSR
ncbi:MAG TPA: phosphotransferase [Capillimicrobium sp.]